MKPNGRGRAVPAEQDRLRLLIEAVLPEARERAKLVAEMREAVLQGDEPQAMRLLRRYLGLPPAEVT